MVGITSVIAGPLDYLLVFYFTQAGGGGFVVNFQVTESIFLLLSRVVKRELAICIFYV